MHAVIDAASAQTESRVFILTNGKLTDSYPLTATRYQPTTTTAVAGSG